MQVVFRPAGYDDLRQLLKFVRKFYAIDNYKFVEPAAMGALASMIADRSMGRVWLIEREQDHVPLGYMVLAFTFSLEYHGRSAMLDELYIDDKWRGHGLGKQAVEFVVHSCRELGVRGLHLEVERSNVAAQKLYRTYGFSDRGRYLWTLDLSKEIDA